MRTINFKPKFFAVGKKIIVTKIYKTGTIYLPIGSTGKITGESHQSIPDMGLFNIRIIDLDFGLFRFSVGESIAEIYMQTI